MGQYFIIFCSQIISLDEHLDSFNALAIMNNAAMNISVQVFVWIYAFISFVLISRSRIAGSFGNSMFTVLRNCHCFSRQPHHFPLPPAMHEGPNLCLHRSAWYCLFYIRAFLMGEMWYLTVALMYISLMANDAEQVC